MLRDATRVEGYRAALEAAAPMLQGATVMDIGTGSGILAFLAAKYGARKIYAIEGSPAMARVASRLARANGLAGTVEVVPKLLEDVSEAEIPSGSVDVIVSELLSHFLVGEVGLQVVTAAKTRFLRPGGLVLPAEAWLKLSLFEDPELGAELRQRHEFWAQRDFYGIDLSAVLPIAEEQALQELVLDVVDPSSLLVPPDQAPGEFLDLVSPSDPAFWNRIEFEVSFPNRSHDAVVDGLCGWWDLAFAGTRVPAPVLSTGPHAAPTVWAQCRFLLQKPLKVGASEKLTARCDLKVHKGRESYTLRLELVNHTTRKSSKTGAIELNNIYARHLARPVLSPDCISQGYQGKPTIPLALT